MQNTRIYNILRYSLIVFPLAFAGIPIYIHAPDYYITNLGLRIETIGFALLLLRILDAFLDPVIGFLSDNLYFYRQKIIYIGSFFLCIGFWMIFHPINSYVLLWFSSSIFLCTLGFSMVAINIQAFGGLWDIPIKQVTAVISIREAIGLFGLLVASVTPTVLYYYFKDDNFHILAVILIFVTVISLVFFTKWFNTSAIKKPISLPGINIKESSFMIFNTDIKLFFVVYSLSCLASSIPATLIIFYVRDYLLAEHLLGVFLLVYFTSGAISMPLWKSLSYKYTCMVAWLLSMIFAFLIFIWAYFLQPNDIFGFFVICLFSGMAVGANLALPSAIIAEFINSNKHEKYAASYYSISNFLSKFSLAFASGIALPFLGFMNYQPGVARNDYLFPTIYALLPCFILLIAIIILNRLINAKTI